MANPCSDLSILSPHTRQHAQPLCPAFFSRKLGADMLSRCICHAQLAAEAERASPPHPSGSTAHEAVSQLRRAATPDGDAGLGGPLTSECSDVPLCAASASSAC